MAQAAKAPTAGPSLEIAITYDPATLQWKADPPNPPKAHVDNQGQVKFNCSQAGGCRVYTDPAKTFVNETNGYEQINQGPNNVFTLDPGTDNTYVSYSVVGPSDPRPRKNPKETGGYSIQCGNPPIEGERR